MPYRTHSTFPSGSEAPHTPPPADPAAPRRHRQSAPVPLRQRARDVLVGGVRRQEAGPGGADGAGLAGQGRGHVPRQLVEDACC